MSFYHAARSASPAATGLGAMLCAFRFSHLHYDGQLRLPSGVVTGQKIEDRLGHHSHQHGACRNGRAVVATQRRHRFSALGLRAFINAAAAPFHSMSV